METGQPHQLWLLQIQKDLLEKLLSLKLYVTFYSSHPLNLSTSPLLQSFSFITLDKKPPEYYLWCQTSHRKKVCIVLESWKRVEFKLYCRLVDATIQSDVPLWPFKVVCNCNIIIHSWFIYEWITDRNCWGKYMCSSNLQRRNGNANTWRNILSFLD